MTITERRGETHEKTAHGRRWKVLLHNDDHHAMDYVVGALCKAIPGLDSEEAGRIMLEAHLNGVGLVIICHQEQAEYYRDRVQTFGLGCSIEPE